MKPTHIMTVDVEDYYQVGAFERVIKPEEWDQYESRVVENTQRILTLFRTNKVKATFFILGCVAEKHPELVKQIAEEGHEVASHGYHHQRANTQTREAFKEDVLKARNLLSSLSGQEVIGYRAPSFSINKQNDWAFYVLKECGYVYSSSTYPIKHDHYGDPQGKIAPYRHESGIIEYPQATISLLGSRVPVGGGGYFRLFPYFISRFFINCFSKQNKHPYIFYFHPWEIDSEQPRIVNISFLSKFRHYVNLKYMFDKVAKLTKKHRWGAFRDVYYYGNGQDK